MSRAGGATLPELMRAFKWQAHSVRDFYFDSSIEARFQDRIVVERRRREDVPTQIEDRENEQRGSKTRLL